MEPVKRFLEEWRHHQILHIGGVLLGIVLLALLAQVVEGNKNGEKSHKAPNEAPVQAAAAIQPEHPTLREKTRKVQFDGPVATAMVNGYPVACDQDNCIWVPLSSHLRIKVFGPGGKKLLLRRRWGAPCVVLLLNTAGGTGDILLDAEEQI